MYGHLLAQVVVVAILGLFMLDRYTTMAGMPEAFVGFPLCL